MHKDKPPEKKYDKEKDAEAADEKAKSKIPDPPECEPQLGDLTPAYIEWVKKYHPDDFEARYKGRIPED